VIARAPALKRRAILILSLRDDFFVWAGMTNEDAAPSELEKYFWRLVML
jgi:hypothetical protein